MEYTDIENSDEREEGEIFDDDLEEISDGSIAPSPKTGKLNSPEENLRAISLSSVSDLEVMECSSVYNSDLRLHRRREVKKRKNMFRHHRRRSSDSSSENEEMMKTKKLLKEAIRRDQEEMHNNSLRTRLTKMVKITPLPHNLEIDSLDNCDHKQDNLTSLETLSILNDEEDIGMNKEPIETERSSRFPDGDDELIQLRLEALKTAVINKFQRKKKKIKLDSQEDTKVMEINKENSSDNVNNQSCTAGNINSIEEISEKNQVVNNSSPNSAINSEDEVDEDILRAVLLASMAKKITNKVSPNLKRNHLASNSNGPNKKQIKIAQVASKPKIDLPKIQPIIISINNPDSDSDDAFNDQECVDELKNDNIIAKKKLEMKIDNFLKQQRAEVEAKSSAITTSKTSKGVNSQTKKNVEINHLYKLLPENKQLEYEKLIQRLKNAEKKPRLKRLSTTRISVNKIQNNKTAECNSTTNKSNLSGSSQLQLRHAQQQVTGRLQDKGKYNELTPLLKRLDQVTLEQKKHEIRIKNLMKQLDDARGKSLKLQNVFDELMKQFCEKKQEIDSNTKAVAVPQPTVKLTQTLSVAKNNTNLQKPSEPTSPEKQISNLTNGSVHCKVILEKCPVDLEDPNDIEFEIKTTKVETSDIPKYSSPLDYMERVSNAE